jgi:hypothetical protein
MLNNWWIAPLQIVVTSAPSFNETARAYYADNSDSNVDLIREEIGDLMWISAIPVLVVALVAAVIFPKQPPLPPSRSSSESRLHFWSGFKTILKNRNAWLIAAVTAVPYTVNITTFLWVSPRVM